MARRLIEVLAAATWPFAAVAALIAASPRGADTGTIEGRVRDAAGSSLKGVQIGVQGTRLVTTSDSTGYYRVLRVPAGTATLVARLAGYRIANTSVQVVAGQTVTQDLQLELVPTGKRLLSTLSESRPVARDEAAARSRAVGLTAYSPATPAPSGYAGRVAFNTEEYRHQTDNRFQLATANPLSTFSIDVDAASYANVRRFLKDGQRPPADAVRIEELVNYFPYSYPEPDGDAPFSITTDVARAPWRETHRLVRIGLHAAHIPVADLPPSNLVFLLDVSGSMDSPDKLPLVKRAFRLLVEQLRPQDRVAVVVYAGAAGVVLPSTPGSDKERILAAIDRLEAGGSTAGGEGIVLAYQIAKANHIAGGNNRVILATDGDFNVGVSSEGGLVRLIEEKREQGTFLTVLGFGTGNLKDSKMEQLADKGNGHYAYVDDIMEARKVFVQELGATLLTVAKDVKIQVEFNPAKVRAYRLVGYENRLLASEDFNDDRKDAGEMGAGHSVTAMYEVVPIDAPFDSTLGLVDSLRYQRPMPSAAARSAELLTLKLRYKAPSDTVSRLLSRVVMDKPATMRTDFRFASAVVAFGMILRDSPYRGAASLEGVLTAARGAVGDDPGGYRAEFVRLVETARRMEVAADTR